MEKKRKLNIGNVITLRRHAQYWYDCPHKEFIVFEVGTLRDVYCYMILINLGSNDSFDWISASDIDWRYKIK